MFFIVSGPGRIEEIYRRKTAFNTHIFCLSTAVYFLNWFHQQFKYGFNRLFIMKRKILIIVAIVAIVVAGVAIAAAGNQGQIKSRGPAPNSGDCIPDGSGYASFDGQGPAHGPGPAPNSGDGIPDGPGW
jgi:hypothetical protein